MNALLLLTAASVGQPPMTLPATQPAPMPMTQPMTGTPPATNGNGNGEAKEEEKKDEPPAPEPYALQRLLSTTRFGSWLDDKGIKVDGWVQGNYTASTANRNNLPITFNDRGDFWQFNQNYFRVAKEVDTSKDEFQLGFRTDWILPGSDARFSLVRGLWDDQLKPAGRNGALPNYHPIDLFQVYAEAFMPNLGPRRVRRSASVGSPRTSATNWYREPRPRS